ncbi:MAG: putative baseplate assembly protein [Acidobacteriota bacterium]|nr:putative baseplate assembly protein [Acidobacteriota bacterium]
MSLQSYIPQIDDRRYEDILAEVRTRIARYTPEWSPVWTDVNDSDPGITLAQVFAWLSELLIYRMSKVPELNYIKFLQLLGIELTPAQPALAELTFPVVETNPESYVIVPLRAQVSAESSDGGPPIIFETDRALTALVARLAAVQVFEGFDYVDVTPENTEPELGFLPFGSLAKTDSALLLGFKFDRDFPPQLELNIAFVTFEAGTTTSASFDCGLPETTAFPSSTLLWEYWNGTEWRGMNLLKDETRALERSGHVYLKTPAKNEMQRAVILPVTDSLYYIRARIARSGYERPPKLLAIRTNTIGALQAETVIDEVLGGSDGRPNQVFTLANTPVLPDNLRIEVDEGDGFKVWKRVADFFGSAAQDQHFVLNPTSGEVRFGDGQNGSIPVANVNNAGNNVVARMYRFGGGKRGNLAAGTLKTLLTSVLGIDENGITNLRAAFGGRDEETLEEAKKRAPQSLKNKCRAVTREDFESLAKQAANIKRAKALPLSHPNFPGVKVPGVVTVIVVPDSDDPKPTPSEGTLRTVCEYLNLRRLLTTELYVVRPTYQEVSIRVDVIAKNDADLGEVKQQIEEGLLNYFHPLKGGEDDDGWPFGGKISFSQVYQQIFTVQGVQSIERLVIVLQGDEIPECKDVPIAEGVLLFSTKHEVRANYTFN